VAPPPTVQGRSFVPLLGGAGPAGGLPPAVSEYSTKAINRTFESLRRDRLTYIVDGTSEQLFDLSTDPGERTNLALVRPAVLATLREELARWREVCRALAARFGPLDGGIGPDAETARRLRALGYLKEE
jgi:hypothetical protein